MQRDIGMVWCEVTCGGSLWDNTALGWLWDGKGSLNMTVNDARDNARGI